MQRGRWKEWFRRYNDYLHPDMASGVFTLEEFAQMVGVARRQDHYPKPSEDLCLLMFNNWNDELDPTLAGECASVRVCECVGVYVRPHTSVRWPRVRACACVRVCVRGQSMTRGWLSLLFGPHSRLSLPSP